MVEKRALIIFSKVPRKGLVKRRLAAQIGTERAFYYFSLLFRKTLNEAFFLAARKFLYLWPEDWTPEELSPFSDLIGAFTLKSQSGADLGERMLQALKEVMGQGFQKVLLVGADIPFLSREILEEAFSALQSKEMVLGPAEDGGYYLIGFRRETSGWEALFEGIPWGGAEVFEKTLKKARLIGVSIHLLPPLFDVDTAEDLSRIENFLKFPPPVAL